MTDAIVIATLTEGIERLYLERLPDGGYDVVCNDLATSVPAPENTWADRELYLSSVLDALINPIADKLDNEDDVAGVRVGYQPRDMLMLAYGGARLTVPDFRLAHGIQAIMREYRDESGVG